MTSEYNNNIGGEVLLNINKYMINRKDENKQELMIETKLTENLSYLKKYYEEKNSNENQNGEHIRVLKEKIDNLYQENAQLASKVAEISRNNISLNPQFNTLTRPVLLKSRNPYIFVKNFIKYQKEKSEFENVVSEYMLLLNKKGKSTKTNYNFESIKENDRCLEIGDKFVRIYYLANLPNYVFAANLFKLINLPLPMLLSYHIRGTNKSSMIKAARQRMSVLESIQNERTRKGKTHDLEIAREVEEISVFVDNLVHDYEKCFLVSIYTAIIADTKNQLIEYDQKFQDETQDIEFTFNT